MSSVSLSCLFGGYLLVFDLTILCRGSFLPTVSFTLSLRFPTGGVCFKNPTGGDLSRTALLFIGVSSIKRKGFKVRRIGSYTPSVLRAEPGLPRSLERVSVKVKGDRKAERKGRD